MQLKKYLVILAALLIFSGCSSKPEVVIETKYVTKSIPIVSRPKKVNLLVPKFYVVTSENYQEFKDQLNKDVGEDVFIAISINGYENLAVSVEELHRYIKQQKEVILYYEKAVTEGKTNE